MNQERERMEKITNKVSCNQANNLQNQRKEELTNQKKYLGGEVKRLKGAIKKGQASLPANMNRKWLILTVVNLKTSIIFHFQVCQAPFWWSSWSRTAAWADWCCCVARNTACSAQTRVLSKATGCAGWFDPIVCEKANKTYVVVHSELV